MKRWVSPGKRILELPVYIQPARFVHYIFYHRLWSIQASRRKHAFFSYCAYHKGPSRFHAVFHSEVKGLLTMALSLIFYVYFPWKTLLASPICWRSNHVRSRVLPALEPPCLNSCIQIAWLCAVHFHAIPSLKGLLLLRYTSYTVINAISQKTWECPPLKVWFPKGTVQRDFQLPVFFIIQTSLGHWSMGLNIFDFG